MVGEVELFESAFNGTVFLEEVGDLSGATHLKLLRFLDRIFSKELCSPLTPHWNLRIVASTSRDLQMDIQSGKFRADLWYRLSMVQIQLPALRERGDDVLLLARNFLAQFSAQYGKVVQRMSRGVEAVLLAYSWPGNISELENVIGRACSVARSEVLECGDLPVGLTLQNNSGAVLPLGGPGPGAGTR
jgi:DNA-binding NtrC family response regulator